jgi:hypothetical protein
MAGIHIDWTGLEQAFENHAPDVRSYLDRESGEVVTVQSQRDEDDPGLMRVQAHPERYIGVEPVPSREQYRMMEQFIETVVLELLQSQLRDAIVGKGAFRRFKDAVGRHPEERKRWFAFRDVLLHQYILEWLKQHRIELSAMPDWSLELPEPGAASETPVPEPTPVPVDGPKQEGTDLRAYLQAWARAHGEEFQYLFGPTAFERLADDMAQEFSFYRRR